MQFSWFWSEEGEELMEVEVDLKRDKKAWGIKEEEKKMMEKGLNFQSHLVARSLRLGEWECELRLTVTSLNSSDL